VNYATPKIKFTVHVLPHISLLKQKNSLPCGSDLSGVDFSLWKALQQKLYRKRSERLIIWSAFYYTARSDKSGHKKKRRHMNCWKTPAMEINIQWIIYRDLHIIMSAVRVHC